MKLKNTPNSAQKPVLKDRVRTSRESALLGLLLAQEGKNRGLTIVAEHKFLENRRFRFDWAIPDLKIGIEYEGLFSGKSRHTTPKGFTGDCEKYNLAAMNGWKVLRYTALNYGQISKDIEQLLKQRA